METPILPEEKEAFRLVREILSQTVSPERIFHGDAKTYFPINLDNNSFRPICRLYLRNGRKYIGTINDKKVETRYAIAQVDDIRQFTSDMLRMVRHYKNNI